MQPDQTHIGADHDRLTSLMIDRQRELFLYIYSLVHHFDDANDILQEVNLALWRDLQQSANVRDFRSWSYRVAYNQVLVHRQRLSHDRLRFDDSLLANLAEKAQCPDEQVDAYQTALRLCARTLPSPSWQLLSMRYEARLSVTAIAQRTGRSVAAVSQSLYRIRGALLRCIRDKLTSTKSTQEEQV